MPYCPHSRHTRGADEATGGKAGCMGSPRRTRGCRTPAGRWHADASEPDVPRPCEPDRPIRKGGCLRRARKILIAWGGLRLPLLPKSRGDSRPTPCSPLPAGPAPCGASPWSQANRNVENGTGLAQFRVRPSRKCWVSRTGAERTQVREHRKRRNASFAGRHHPEMG